MSEEQLKAFLEKLKDDSSLQEKLKAASDADAASAIAKEAGFSISADEFTKAQSTELSDEELEGVAGGEGKTDNETWELQCRCGAARQGHLNTR